MGWGRLVSPEAGQLCGWGRRDDTPSTSWEGGGWEGCPVGGTKGVTGLSRVHFSVPVFQVLYRRFDAAGRSLLCRWMGWRKREAQSPSLQATHSAAAAAAAPYQGNWWSRPQGQPSWGQAGGRQGAVQTISIWPWQSGSENHLPCPPPPCRGALAEPWFWFSQTGARAERSLCTARALSRALRQENMLPAGQTQREEGRLLGAHSQQGASLGSRHPEPQMQTFWPDSVSLKA